MIGDGPNQVQILDLLRTLQNKTNLTILFISHDLPAVAFLCGRIAVLRDGKILEETKTSLFLRQPARPYSRSLVDASRY